MNILVIITEQIYYISTKSNDLLNGGQTVTKRNFCIDLQSYITI